MSEGPAFSGQAMVQQRRPGGDDGAHGSEVVASGLVQHAVQRRPGEGNVSLGNDTGASGLVRPGLQLRRGDGGEASGLLGGAHRVHAAAVHGVATSASSLPHLDAIQRSFGRHDVSAVQAHTGSEARASADAMGADAYATGNHVVLGRGTDLFTTAHEAAHVVQQRAGVQLKGGVGEVGDAYERHADQVADLVVQGKSAEALLDQHAGGGATGIAEDHPIQKLSGTHYSDAIDRNNVRDGIVQAIRADLGGLDWTQYWNHITLHHHNTQSPVGNSSTFGGDTQQNILGYIQNVLNSCAPYFNNSRLVFDSTVGGICNGLHQQGHRTNVRVIVDVSNVEDEVFFSDQVDAMVVENAYPIV